MGDSIESKILALSAAVPTERDRKREAFARLQAEDQEAADFVRNVAEVFGRPSAARIEFADGTVFSTGRWG